MVGCISGVAFHRLGQFRGSLSEIKGKKEIIGFLWWVSGFRAGTVTAVAWVRSLARELPHAPAPTLHDLYIYIWQKTCESSWGQSADKGVTMSLHRVTQGRIRCIMRPALWNLIIGFALHAPGFSSLMDPWAAGLVLGKRPRHLGAQLLGFQGSGACEGLSCSQSTTRGPQRIQPA